MPLTDRLQTRAAEARAVARMLPQLLRARPGSTWTTSRMLAERAEKNPEEVAIAYAERRLTWREVDRQVNRAANALWQAGVRPGDAVALLMDNRPEFLVAATAIARVRAVGALINTNVTGKALAHAIRVSNACRVVVGSEHAESLAAALPELERLGPEQVFEYRDPEGEEQPARFESYDDRIDAERESPPAVPGETTVGEPAFYIYTSGTTGLPKAAIISGLRLIMAGSMFGRGIFELVPGDVHYVTLPLYHSAGFFGGWMATLQTGATLALRRKFSASRFIEDVRRFDATSFIYIGELCRYLMNTPESSDDRRHRLRVASGNGLRPDIWDGFQQRFAIPLIREYYGATEGSSPVINFSGRSGMVGRLMPGSAIVRCDLETGEIQRGAGGYCERLPPTGNTGLLLSRIAGSANFDGYLDEQATNKKILESVFKQGDRYFNSGDLLTLHEDNWLTFADRVGDTFRWKGENVSTNEVAEILNGATGVEESNVYGVQVPGSEGRAGMASLHVADEFSIERFAAYVMEHLAVYQRPYFVRLQQGMRITGTFKHQKVDYQREGYDPSKVADALYMLDGEKYVPLDASVFDAIQSGRITLR